VRHELPQGHVKEPAILTIIFLSTNALNERESSAAKEIVATPTQSHSRGRGVPPHAPRRSARIAARRAGE